VSFSIAGNLMNKLDKLIKIIRELKEDVGAAAVPTNSANAAGLGFNPYTETPPVFGKKKKNAYLGSGSRSRWMQRRKPPQ
jgi:hypothetical protein